MQTRSWTSSGFSFLYIKLDSGRFLSEHLRGKLHHPLDDTAAENQVLDSPERIDSKSSEWCSKQARERSSGGSRLHPGLLYHRWLISRTQ